MKYKNVLITALVALVVSFISVKAFVPSGGVAVQKESAFDRVMRTKTLRCGYGTWEPGVYKDSKTGRMAGIFVELTEAAAKLNGLRVEWASEVDWGQIPAALASGKVDAFCSGMADDGSRGAQMFVTTPVSFWTFDIIVRADDDRFKGDTISIDDLNKSDYATAYTEGDVLETIAKTDLPNVKGVPLPPLGTPADNLMHVITGKTDFVVFPKVIFQHYEKTNPGKIKFLSVVPPLRVYGNVIATEIGDSKLQQMLNTGINELTNSGTYAKIMAKYDALYPGAFLSVAKPYEVKK